MEELDRTSLGRYLITWRNSRVWYGIMLPTVVIVMMMMLVIIVIVMKGSKSDVDDDDYYDDEALDIDFRYGALYSNWMDGPQMPPDSV